MLSGVIERYSRHLVRAVQAVNDAAMSLIPDLDGAVVRAAHDERRSTSGGVARVDIPRVTLQPLDALARRHVKHADSLVRRGSVDVCSVDRKLQYGST